MAENYAKESIRELQKIVNGTPPDMPHAIKANNELARRSARRAQTIAIVTVLISLASLAVAIAALS